MSQPAADRTSDATRSMAASIARIEQRRGVAIDVLGIALAIGGLACLGTFLVITLGLARAALVLASLAQIGLGVAIMRRSAPLPGWAQVRPARVIEPDLDDDEVEDPGAPYAPARTLGDGAPPSPMSGR